MGLDGALGVEVDGLGVESDPCWGAEGAGMGWWMGLGSRTTPRALLESGGGWDGVLKGARGRNRSLALCWAAAGGWCLGGVWGRKHTPPALLGSGGGLDGIAVGPGFEYGPRGSWVVLEVDGGRWGRFQPLAVSLGANMFVWGTGMDERWARRAWVLTKPPRSLGEGEGRGRRALVLGS